MTREHIAGKLMILASQSDPQEFSASIYAIVGSVITNLPSDYWEELCKPKPCGIPGCDCHTEAKPKTIEFCKFLREKGNEMLHNQQSIVE